MRSTRLSSLLKGLCSSLVLAGLLVGCASKAKSSEESAAPLSAQDAAAVRERYMRANPQVRVGIVAAVSADTRLVAVGDLPLQDFAIGDVVTFVDASEKPFNTGTVVNATAQYLHVRYDTSGRAPREGELAVHFRE